MLMDGECDWYMAGGLLLRDGVKGEYCRKLTIVGDPFFEHGLGYVLPKNSTLTDTLSHATLKLKEQGKLVNPSESAAKDQCPDVTDSAMTWQKLSGFFICAYAILILFAVITIFDQHYYTPPKEEENVTNDNEAIARVLSEV